MESGKRHSALPGANVGRVNAHARADLPESVESGSLVVWNSGFTFREFDYLNNARQVPHLPDWAMVDITTPADSKRPGRIAAAGFFNEAWQ